MADETAPAEAVEPEAIPRESSVRTIVGTVVSIVAIGGCVLWALEQDGPRFPQGLGNVSLLGAGILVYLVATLLRGGRWDKILRYLRIEHRRSDAYALVAVGYMGNTVLPARGGEFLRVFLMAERSKARRREVLGSIVSERLLDLISLVVLLVVLAVTRVAEPPGGDVTAYLAITVLALGVAAAFAYLRLRVAGHLEDFAAKVRPLVRASRQLLTATGLLLLAVTLVTWAAEGTIFWLVAQALDVDLGPSDGLAVVVIASLSALIPAGPGYAGTYDAAALFALAEYDVRGGTALSCVLLFRFVVFVPITIAGLALLLGRYRGMRSALRGGSSAT